jgi:hypothetical protein
MRQTSYRRLLDDGPLLCLGGSRPSGNIERPAWPHDPVHFNNVFPPKAADFPWWIHFEKKTNLSLLMAGPVWHSSQTLPLLISSYLVSSFSGIPLVPRIPEEMVLEDQDMPILCMSPFLGTQLFCIYLHKVTY